jgi:DNA-binding LacI/PurR family transcriptional regulator
VANITDVARRAGVSKTTVSRVLNGKYEFMSPETRERVEAAIRDLQFNPNTVARSLKQKRTRLIGAIVANIMNPFSTAITRGMEDYCRSAGYHLIVCNADDSPETERQYVQALRARQLDGLAINTTGQNRELFSELAAVGYPMVLLDRKLEGVNADTVVLDNARGTALAMNHLLGRGLKRIGIVVYPPDGLSSRLERLMGYRRALEEAGLPVEEELIRIAEPKPGAAREKAMELLRLPNRPDAIFATNYLVNLEVLSAVKQVGLSAPKDVAIMGFDDSEWAPLLDPPLTTVAQPTYEMGRTAAELLIKRIEAKRQRTPALHLMEPKLIIRKSCGE